MNNESVLPRYEAGLATLATLVAQRNQMLFELETLARLAGMVPVDDNLVAEFNLEAASQLLRKIGMQTQMIALAMEEVNCAATECGKAPVDWLPMPSPPPNLLVPEDGED